MAKKINQTAGREQLGEFAPMFAHLNDDILFGEVWNDETLSLKQRSVLTVTTLLASGISDSSLAYHLNNAKNHGVSREEIAAIITHVGMYAGWPKAWAGFRYAKEIWNDPDDALTQKDKFQREIFFPIGEANDAYKDFFTGQSYLATLNSEGLFVANVTFSPRCRNHWHIHRSSSGGGQLLICVGGEGIYQKEGEEPVRMVPGSVVYIPSNVKHWHGASESWFAHLAIEIPGANCKTEWLEEVDEESYQKALDFLR